MEDVFGMEKTKEPAFSEFPSAQIFQLRWVFVIPERYFKHLFPGSGTKFEMIESANVFGMCRHSLRPQTLALRNQGRVPETLAEKKIALLGTGALGSCIGDLLAKAGAGELHLFDKDLMEVGNSIRHIVGI